MYTELKPMLVNRFVEVYVAESSYGVSQRVQMFKGIVSKTEKFGYAIFMPITTPAPSSANKTCKGVNYIVLDESTIMEIVDLSQATSRMVLNKAPVIQKVADLEFLFGIDPLKKLEEMETQSNHFIFKDFYLDIEFCREGARMPSRANHDDAGMDVYSPDEYVIPPRGDVIIPTGLKTAFPKGFALIFKEKSGRATKNKLDIGACVVDAGYQGEVHVHLFNNSDNEVKIPVGEKIAQFVIVPVWHGIPRLVNSIQRETTRGAGGFGSSGLS